MDKQNERRLLWDACYNIRDLGGYATHYNNETRWGAFVRADNLARLSLEGQAALIAYGVRTIIDLRSAYELDIDPPPFALTSGLDGYPHYLNLPMLDEDDVEGMELLNQMQSLFEMYCLIVDRFKSNIVQIMHAIAEAADGTILFHCHSGRDRTGLIAALLLSMAGADAATIAQDYAISSTYIQPTFEKTLTEQPKIMVDLLAHLETKYGGTRTYLLKSGMSKQELTHIQSYLLG
ncbi:MAG: tyrosine-protein phosphatase [Chloroflexi bacterium]|nr:tyrosine-protein phosphatase [Chloroflexota bacterium]